MSLLNIPNWLSEVAKINTYHMCFCISPAPVMCSGDRRSRGPSEVVALSVHSIILAKAAALENTGTGRDHLSLAVSPFRTFNTFNQSHMWMWSPGTLWNRKGHEDVKDQKNFMLWVIWTDMEENQVFWDEEKMCCQPVVANLTPPSTFYNTLQVPLSP